MAEPMHEITGRFIQSLHELSDNERRMVDAMLHRMRSRKPMPPGSEELSFGERLADRIAAFGGSWTFILIFCGILITWVIVNGVLLTMRGDTFDPYPYILLNLVLSMLAALQAPVIMMSQNRQAAKDRQQVEYDYAVDTKAESEIAALHEKLDTLRDAQWRELVAMQQQQIEMLTNLLKGRS